MFPPIKTTFYSNICQEGIIGTYAALLAADGWVGWTRDVESKSDIQKRRSNYDFLKNIWAPPIYLSPLFVTNERVCQFSLGLYFVSSFSYFMVSYIVLLFSIVIKHCYYHHYYYSGFGFRPLLFERGRLWWRNRIFSDVSGRSLNLFFW